jgi:hypothetical protein
MTKIAGSGSRIRMRIQDPDPDSFVRGMDPRIRIRIHPKMSWIRNTAMNTFLSKFSLESVISDTVAHHFYIAHFMMLDTEYPSGVVDFVFYIQTYSRIPFPTGSFHFDSQMYAKVKYL